jgi:hypothetical protein
MLARDVSLCVNKLKNVYGHATVYLLDDITYRLLKKRLCGH